MAYYLYAARLFHEEDKKDALFRYYICSLLKRVDWQALQVKRRAASKKDQLELPLFRSNLKK